MKTYKPFAVWMMSSIFEIEAESLEEAIEKCEGPDTPLPEGNFVDGSFEVNQDIAYDDYPEGI